MEEANAPPEEIEEVTKKASSIKVASTMNVHAGMGGMRESWKEPLQKVDIELRDYVHELIDKIEEKTNKKI